MKDFTYYKTKEVYPAAKLPIECCSVKYSTKKCPNFCPNCGKVLQTKKEALINEFQTQLAKFRTDERRLFLEFKQDLFDEFDVTNNPKAERCFNISWDQSHSEGYYSVYETFEELVELIK